MIACFSCQNGSCCKSMLLLQIEHQQLTSACTLYSRGLLSKHGRGNSFVFVEAPTMRMSAPTMPLAGQAAPTQRNHIQHQQEAWCKHSHADVWGSHQRVSTFAGRPQHMCSAHAAHMQQLRLSRKCTAAADTVLRLWLLQPCSGARCCSCTRCHARPVGLASLPSQQQAAV